MSVSKAVLITGCSSGIGWATAERLVDVGWRVYATARNIEKLAPLEKRGASGLQHERQSLSAESLRDVHADPARCRISGIGLDKAGRRASGQQGQRVRA